MIIPVTGDDQRRDFPKNRDDSVGSPSPKIDAGQLRKTKISLGPAPKKNVTSLVGVTPSNYGYFITVKPLQVKSCEPRERVILC